MKYCPSGGVLEGGMPSPPPILLCPLPISSPSSSYSLSWGPGNRQLSCRGPGLECLGLRRVPDLGEEAAAGSNKDR